MREVPEPADCPDAANKSCAEVVGADCESLTDQEELPIAKGVDTLKQKFKGNFLNNKNNKKLLQEYIFKKRNQRTKQKLNKRFLKFFMPL